MCILQEQVPCAVLYQYQAHDGKTVNTCAFMMFNTWSSIVIKKTSRKWNFVLHIVSERYTILMHIGTKIIETLLADMDRPASIIQKRYIFQHRICFNSFCYLPRRINNSRYICVKIMDLMTWRFRWRQL